MLLCKILCKKLLYEMKTPPKFPPFPLEAGITWNTELWAAQELIRGSGTPEPAGWDEGPQRAAPGGSKAPRVTVLASTFNYVLMYVMKEVEHLKNPKYYFKYKF